MPRISHEQEDEYFRLRSERRAFDQLMAQLAAYEAAMRVIAKRGLMQEFAEEIRSITACQQDTRT